MQSSYDYDVVRDSQSDPTTPNLSASYLRQSKRGTVLSWNNQDIIQWLKSTSFAQFHSYFLFVRTGQELLNLTRKELTSMGIPKSAVSPLFMAIKDLMNNPKQLSISRWTNADILKWISGGRFATYVQCFEYVQSGSDLMRMTLEDLVFMGMPNPIASQLLSEINELAETTSSDDYYYAHKYNIIFDKLVKDSSITNEAWNELQELGDIFVHNCKMYGRLIIEESLSLPTTGYKKTLSPTAIGGVAGGVKYICGGILFKFADDVHLGSRWLYGGLKKNNELASKSAGQELLSANFFCSFSPIIRTPLMAVVDYWGYRLLATALLPLNESSLLYGSSNGGKSVSCDEPILSYMNEIASIFNLKSHQIQNTFKSIVCGDIEVHECHFRNSNELYYYCVDPARLFPPEHVSNGSWADTSSPYSRYYLPPKPFKQSIFSQKLRPEFVKQFAVPLSPDGFSNFQNVSETKSLDDDIVTATLKLHSSVEAYVDQLIKPETMANIIDHTSRFYLKRWSNRDYIPNPLICHLHQHGFNLRHLGKIFDALLKRKEVKAGQYLTLIKYIQTVIVVRVIKNYTRQIIRDLKTSKQYVNTIVEIMNKIASERLNSSDYYFESKFWNVVVPGLVSEKFGIELQCDNQFQILFHQGFSIIYFCQLMGVILHPNCYDLMINQYGYNMHITFTASDIVEVNPVIKYSNFIDLATGISLYNSAVAIEEEAINIAKVDHITEDYYLRSYHRIISFQSTCPSLWASQEMNKIIPLELADILQKVQKFMSDKKMIYNKQVNLNNSGYQSFVMKREVVTAELQFLPLKDTPLKNLSEKKGAFNSHAVTFLESIGQPTVHGDEIFRGRCYTCECSIRSLKIQDWADQRRERFKEELITLTYATHHRLLRFLGAYFDDARIYIVSDDFSKGSLADFISYNPHLENSDEIYIIQDNVEDRELPAKKKFAIIIAIIQGMIFLHENKIYHLHLSPESIMLDNDLNPKIADYGLSCIMGREHFLARAHSTRSLYTPPELLKITSDALSTVDCAKVDIFAFGLLVYEFWLQEKCDQRLLRLADDPAAQLFGTSAGSLGGSGSGLSSAPSTSSLRGGITSSGGMALSMTSSLGMTLTGSSSAPSTSRFPPTLQKLIQRCVDVEPQNRIEFKRIEELNQVLGRQTAQNSMPRLSYEENSFFVIFMQIARSEEEKSNSIWHRLEHLDANNCLPWRSFIQQYPILIGWPTTFFTEQEQFIFKSFLLPGHLAEDQALVSKKDFEKYLKFYDVKPNFNLLDELLHIPYFYVALDPSLELALLQDKLSFLVRQSNSIPAYIINYEMREKICTFALTNESMDLEGLIRLIKYPSEVVNCLTVNSQVSGKFKSRLHPLHSHRDASGGGLAYDKSAFERKGLTKSTPY